MGKRTDADVLVIGAGVFGLAAAFVLAGTGRRVLIAEAGAPGAGASGGPVGALAPYGPGPAEDPRRRFQAAALAAAEADWAAVAAAGGIDPGYARLGRLTPLASPEAGARAAAAGGIWRLVASPPDTTWLASDAASCGVLAETVSARVVPDRALAALRAAVRARHGELWEGASVGHVAPGAAHLADGSVLRAAAVVVAAGNATRRLLPVLPLRRGVKGQAALLAAEAPPGAPILSAPGLWVVPRPDGMVAVGSTSEAAWTTAGPDERLDAVIGRARALVPRLAKAPVAMRWAGIRPRAAGPDPLVGPVPGLPGVHVATGGFKTGFATAFPVARALLAMLEGREADLLPGMRTASETPPAGTGSPGHGRPR